MAATDHSVGSMSSAGSAGSAGAATGPSAQGFELVSSDVFSALTSGYDNEYIKKQTEVTTEFNKCDDCKVAMNYTVDGYECPGCKAIKQIVGNIHDCSEESGGVIKMRSGAGGSNMYTGVQEYAKTQRKIIMDDLMKKNEEFSGKKFQKNVLTNVATKYNEIQKATMITTAADGTVEERKYVWRGDLKKEVLASLISYECISAGVARQSKDICQFMQLGTAGFSRGENKMRELQAAGVVQLPLNVNPTEDYAVRFLESLKLYDADECMTAAASATSKGLNYKKFVVELVETAVKKNIGLTSMLPSMVVGAIWVLNIHAKLKLEVSAVEEACDKVRKNTFMKFVKVIEENLVRFVQVFQDNGIPLNIRGRIVRKKITA